MIRLETKREVLEEILRCGSCPGHIVEGENKLALDKQFEPCDNEPCGKCHEDFLDKFTINKRESGE